MDQVFDNVFGQVCRQIFDQGFWTRKYSVEFYQDEENQEKTMSILKQQLLIYNYFGPEICFNWCIA